MVAPSPLVSVTGLALHVTPAVGGSRRTFTEVPVSATRLPSASRAVIDTATESPATIAAGAATTS